MFEIVKQKVDLLQHIADDLNVPLREGGTDTFIIDDETQHGGCPNCGHRDCFRIKFEENSPEESFYHCFSCGIHGDVISWDAWRKGVTPKEAALGLVKAYSLSIPNDYNPIQEIFDLAARYYHECFLESENVPQVRLGKMTPTQFQTEVRKHKLTTLEHFKLGWSDGKLTEYLEGIGIDTEILVESGLVKNGKDFLPSGVFIYPHYCGGKVSHFTFKDPSKKLAYQIPNKFVLNKVMFYNQDSLKGKREVIIVEGENDLLSVYESEEFDANNTAVIATIGSLSGGQIEWLREKVADYKVITLFDPDEAGDKYRSRLEAFKRNFASLVQLKPSENDDIDKVLSEGGSLSAILAQANSVPVEANTRVDPVEGSELVSRLGSPEHEETSVLENGALSEDVVGDGAVIQRGNCYYKVKFPKEGPPIYTRISDFVIKLKSIYIKEDGERHREVYIVNRDGSRSVPFFLTSANKVSLSAFRTLIANASDSTFKGSEHDLADMWSLVYEQNGATEVHETRVVGWNEKLQSWIFRNVMITSTAEVILPDDNGVFWLPGRTTGVKPESITDGIQDSADIPELDMSMSPEEVDALIVEFMNNLARNIGHIGEALLLMGWAKACMFSHWINPKVFPFLYFWGTKGEGKTTLIKWLARFYGLGEECYTTVKMIGTAVGLTRKAEYYSSLPLIIDEMRADSETQRHISLFRSFYDKSPRSIGTSNSFGIRTQKIRSCFAYMGEDQVEDPAFKERCISLRVPVKGREMEKTYRWMEDNKNMFSNIGFTWVKESCGSVRNTIREDVANFERELVQIGCTKRNSKHWAMVGYFGVQIAEKYCPDFNFKEFLVQASKEDAEHQKEESTIAIFFNKVSMLRSEEDSPITSDVCMIEGDKLHIWFMQLFRYVSKDDRMGFPFSRTAVMGALKDEPYYLHGPEGTRVRMGMSDEKRAVMTFDLSKAPDFVKDAFGYEK